MHFYFLPLVKRRRDCFVWCKAARLPCCWLAMGDIISQPIITQDQYNFDYPKYQHCKIAFNILHPYYIHQLNSAGSGVPAAWGAISHPSTPDPGPPQLVFRRPVVHTAATAAQSAPGAEFDWFICYLGITEIVQMSARTETSSGIK